MHKKICTNRLPAYTRLTIGSVAAASAAGTTDAAIVYFDVNPGRTINAGQQMIFGNINIANGTYSTGTYGGESFTLSLQQFAQASLYNGYGNGSVLWGSSGGYVLNFGFGDLIGSAIASWNAGYGYLTRNGNGPWTAGANAYAPLRINQGGGNYNYGWVAIDYDTLGRTATITGFAFEDQINTPIEAGAVPEPSTYALLALAGLFGAAVWHHRRHQRGASPALLQLAAGTSRMALYEQEASGPLPSFAWRADG